MVVRPPQNLRALAENNGLAGVFRAVRQLRPDELESSGSGVTPETSDVRTSPVSFINGDLAAQPKRTLRLAWPSGASVCVSPKAVSL